MIKRIELVANQILDQTPDTVVRFRLMRDVLKLPIFNQELMEVRDYLDDSKQIQFLQNEQRSDGSWGAFHSRSTKNDQIIPSTEVGVERAISLGLDSSHPVLGKAADYIFKVMNGQIDFPDYHEKNDRWQTGMRLFLASTLSLIHSGHSILDRDRELWHQIASQTFQSGEYDEKAEIQIHRELTGATVKDSYLVLNNRYQLNILGSIPGTLSEKLETSILRWLWDRPDGIGYLNVPLYSFPTIKPGVVDRWLTSIELLARLFPSWVRFSESMIDWIWKHQDERRYWDFGPRPSSLSNLPLSDSWRKRTNRVFDWSTRVLILLRKYYDDRGHQGLSSATYPPLHSTAGKDRFANDQVKEIGESPAAGELIR